MAAPHSSLPALAEEEGQQEQQQQQEQEQEEPDQPQPSPSAANITPSHDLHLRETPLSFPPTPDARGGADDQLQQHQQQLLPPVRPRPEFSQVVADACVLGAGLAALSAALAIASANPTARVLVVRLEGGDEDDEEDEDDGGAACRGGAVLLPPGALAAARQLSPKLAARLHKAGCAPAARAFVHDLASDHAFWSPSSSASSASPSSAPSSSSSSSSSLSSSLVVGRAELRAALLASLPSPPYSSLPSDGNGSSSDGNGGAGGRVVVLGGGSSSPPWRLTAMATSGDATLLTLARKGGENVRQDPAMVVAVRAGSVLATCPALPPPITRALLGALPPPPPATEASAAAPPPPPQPSQPPSLQAWEGRLPGDAVVAAPPHAESWWLGSGGRAFATHPLRGGDVAWLALAPPTALSARAGGDAEDDEENEEQPPSSKAHLVRLFADFPPAVRLLLANTPASAVLLRRRARSSSMLAMRPRDLPPWFGRGAHLLCGDGVRPLPAAVDGVLSGAAALEDGAALRSALLEVWFARDGEEGEEGEEEEDEDDAGPLPTPAALRRFELSRRARWATVLGASAAAAGAMAGGGAPAAAAAALSDAARGALADLGVGQLFAEVVAEEGPAVVVVAPLPLPTPAPLEHRHRRLHRRRAHPPAPTAPSLAARAARLALRAAAAALLLRAAVTGSSAAVAASDPSSRRSLLLLPGARRTKALAAAAARRVGGAVVASAGRLLRRRAAAVVTEAVAAAPGAGVVGDVGWRSPAAAAVRR